MCFLVYLSTTSLEDLSRLPSKLYHLLPLTTEDNPDIVNLLDYPARWYLESQYGGCSCHFRHLFGGGSMDFAPPADWCPEDAEDIEATRAVYDALAVLLAEGHKVDVMDIGANAPPEAITTLDVSLSEVDRDAFRFFENHKFNLSLKEESCKVNSFLRITTALARKIRESCKLLSILGIGVAVSCLWVATRLYPGGYDWSRGMISTLLRGPAGPARILAIVGVLFFCVSIALVFERLAHAVEFSKNSTVIRIGGIGSMVYASLTFTPIHDLMVTISLIFFLVAAFTITQALYVSREIGFFVAGCVCLVVLVASATIYYMGYYASVLPWAQRVSFALFAIWLVALDYSFPRKPGSRWSRWMVAR